MNIKDFKNSLDMNLMKGGTDLPVLFVGLSSEAGEVGDEYQKQYLGLQTGIQARENLRSELGDLMYYIFQIAKQYNLSIEEILEDNIKKRFHREQYGKED